MPTSVRSHAKINLGLGIGAPRADGFHALATVYQTLELYDEVTVTARPATTTVLRLTSNDSRVPCDERNTVWKMVLLALTALGIPAEVEIHIEKRLPVQGGMGAGSANAVAALVGLEAELGIGVSQVRKSGPGAPAWKGNTGPSTAFAAKNAANFAQDDSFVVQDDSFVVQDDSFVVQDDRSIWEARRLEIAAQVGSDVPLFLIGGTVLGLDRGQQVTPLPEIEPVWCVVALPEIGVSTPQAFRDWDALCLAEGLTAEASTDKLNKLSRAYVSAFAEATPAVSGESIAKGGQGAGSSGVPVVDGNLAGPQGSVLVRTGISSWIVNDFERVVFPQHPSLAEIKHTLAATGTPGEALHASLSGSGSALFGLYRTQGDAEAARARLDEAGVRSLLTRTLPRPKYWREMLLV